MYAPTRTSTSKQCIISLLSNNKSLNTTLDAHTTPDLELLEVALALLRLAVAVQTDARVLAVAAPCRQEDENVDASSVLLPRSLCR